MIEVEKASYEEVLNKIDNLLSNAYTDIMEIDLHIRDIKIMLNHAERISKQREAARRNCENAE